MQILLARPRGFCAGVTRAVSIVERALAIYGAPVYVHHEIVHNRTIVRALKEKGAVFVNSLASVPDGATLIFSAHGVPKAIEDAARARPLTIFDATCPLVTRFTEKSSKCTKRVYPLSSSDTKGTRKSKALSVKSQAASRWSNPLTMSQHSLKRFHRLPASRKPRFRQTMRPT